MSYALGRAHQVRVMDHIIIIEMHIFLTSNGDGPQGWKFGPCSIICCLKLVPIDAKGFDGNDFIFHVGYMAMGPNLEVCLT